MTYETCDHSTKRQCRRVFVNGVTHYGFQCTVCGEWFGAAKAKINLQEAVDFDESIRDQYREARNRFYEQQRLARLENLGTKTWAERHASSADYEEYMQSERWKQMRKAILERDDYTCQGCLSARAVHVHHLTYRNLGSELAFELVSLCVNCHEKTHDLKSVDLSGIMSQ